MTISRSSRLWTIRHRRYHREQVWAAVATTIIVTLAGALAWVLGEL